MCGVVGILLDPRATDPRKLHAIEMMTAQLYHRGPDDSGLWMDREAGIALGHRRLAIIDLSEAGHEPMPSPSGTLMMTYNGEVYNFAELRSELAAQGYRFRGHCDAEVMLAAFECFGVEPAVQRFAGMFAFAVWNRREHVLHLVRDRMGKKPLYVALIDGALVFASELRAILAFPGFQPSVDHNALSMVLRQGWIPDQQCVWKDVFKLPPGTMLSVRPDELAYLDVEGLRQRVRSWWSLSTVAESGQRNLLCADVAEIEDELDRLLRICVSERMLSDVPLGAFLSGGIDSSVVVALMQAQSARPVRTFTIGFDETGYNEADAAAAVASHLGTEHMAFHITPIEARAVIPELPKIWDEPFADESQIPTLLVSRLARQHVTVALSGDGGDETFGGYTRHFVSASVAPFFSLPSGVRRVAATTLRALSPDVMQGLLRVLPLSSSVRRALGRGDLRKFSGIIGAADDGELYQRLTAFDGDRVAGRPDSVGAAGMPLLPDLLSRLLYRDMLGYLPGNILVKVDRASMAVALEARCPLLDHRLIEFAWRLPSNLKVRGGKGKFLLRRILGRYVPEALYERPKHGFNVPIGEWLKGPLREWAEELLGEPQLRRSGFLDAATVRSCWQEHLIGRRDRSSDLWAMLMVQAWLNAARCPDTRPSGARMMEATTSGDGWIELASSETGR
ncbi:MAG: asparagine synthase (glutamine-hydrolyzing) [Rhodopila sp.]|nr:asparagine synthase (glutamine-hydrolyzing) [Rhodopila sp.]